MEDKIVEEIKERWKDLSAEKLDKAAGYCGGALCDVQEILDILMPFYPDDDVILAVMLKNAYVLGELEDDEVKNSFGNEVLKILRTLKKINSFDYSYDKEHKIESIRKMLVAVAKDIRIIVIELATQLQQIKNLKEGEEENKSYADEVLAVYVPIASRLGIYNLKNQLEDVAFKYSDPEAYKDVTAQLDELKEGRDTSIEKISDTLSVFLKEKGVEAQVVGRIKSAYSIYKKLGRKGLQNVSELYDIFAMRVIIPTVVSDDGKEKLDNLYGTLGLIHSEWKPISRKFKDYIAVPKANGYRSLHTVLLGLAPKDMDQPVEVQIRSEKMHHDAEFGFASHWLYKDADAEVNEKMAWLKALSEISFDDTEVNLFADRIFVLTPRGEVKDLPRGATPIDFAYSVHTDVGNKCVMAKINGAPVSLDYQLRNGEVVEIVTRKDAEPKLKWLSVVKTNFAKSKIKGWFSALNKENNLKEGKRLLNLQLERIGKPLMTNNYSVLKDYLGRDLSLAQREKIVEEVGKGAKFASDVVKKVFPYEESLSAKIVLPESVNEREFTGLDGVTSSDNILVGGEAGLPVRIASCCSPKNGVRIVGYVTRGKSISIHRADCQLLEKMDVERIIVAHWKGSAPKDDNAKFRVGIKIEVLPRVGLMRDCTSIMATLGIDIIDVQLRRSGAGVNINEDCFLVDLRSLDQFDTLIDRLIDVPGVLKVTTDSRFVGEEKLG